MNGLPKRAAAGDLAHDDDPYAEWHVGGEAG